MQIFNLEKNNLGAVIVGDGTNKTYRVVDDTKLNSADGYAQIFTHNERVQAKVETMSSTSLADTANILYVTDTITIDAGEVTAD